MATTSSASGAGPGADPKPDTKADPGAKPAARADTAAAAVDEAPKVVVTEAPKPFATKTGDVPDPRTGEAFAGGGAGLKGQSGMDVVGETGNVVAGVDPDRIPAEVTPGVTPNAGGDALLAAAQAKAPSLTREFVDKMGLDDAYLAQIARGEVPPPPTPGPLHSADLHLTPGGWQQTPPGVPPADVGANSIAR